VAIFEKKYKNYKNNKNSIKTAQNPTKIKIKL